MSEICVFCLSDTVVKLFVQGKEYWRCSSCGGYFAGRDLLPTAEAERRRYELHRNDPDEPGFRKYLEGFINPVLDAVSRMDTQTRTIFDYGCGPESPLVRILGEKNWEVRGWDPFFAPETEPFPCGADLVVCHEVAEHFFEPRKDFALMAECVRPGGFLAVGTMLVPERADGAFFSAWWYRQDFTHVSFYSDKALEVVALSAGFCPAGRVGKDTFIFRKKTADQASIN